MALSRSTPVGSLRAGLAIDDAAGRIGRLRGDAGQLQRPAVDDGHVPVVAAQEHGPVGDVLVEQLGGGQLAGEGAIVVPLAAQQPAVARQLAIEVAQALAELGLVLGVLERHLGQAQAGAEQMNVAVVEARHDAAALADRGRAFSVQPGRGFPLPCRRRQDDRGRPPTIPLRAAWD